MSDERATLATHVRFPIVLASAVGVWATYFVLVTVRGIIVDGEFDPDGLWRRGLTTLAGMAFTLMIWLVLRRFDARSLRTRIAAILVLALPAALATAWVNHLAFAGMDKARSLLDDGAVRVERDPDGYYVVSIPGAQPVKVRDPKADDPKMIWKELTDIALGRYFLLLAWGALFLALANAEAVRAAERREAELRRAAKAAELRSLRYQVNPHFLFNTLNSLSALVLTGRTAAAEEMIQSIATFYRTSLTGDATVDVPLSDEIQLQRLYLDVEGVRFPKRLRVTIDLPTALATACVPGLILQPLVENAVKHGVASTMRPVTIRITAVATDDTLMLIVADDGPGGSTDAQGCGIGLTNVRDRLQARFGDAAKLRIARDAGFVVTLTMPLTHDGC